MLQVSNLHESLEHVEKKNEGHKFWNFEIKESENIVRSMSKNPRFRGPFNKQHDKRAQALLKSV